METDEEEVSGDQRSTIRRLNDDFRRDLRLETLVVTQGVAALGNEVVKRVLLAVREFDAFSPDNDPYGEGDFGSLELDGQTIFWKVDYYDVAMTMHSPNPANPAVTRRVMTILMADEY